MKEKPTVHSPFFRVFPSDCIHKATNDVNVHFFIHSYTFRDELIMDDALAVKKKNPASPFLYPCKLEIFCFKVVVVISIQKTAIYLCIIQEAPCFIPCNYVVKEFFVFISHIDEVTKNACVSFCSGISI